MDSKAVVTLAKVETTYGVDAACTGADAVVTSKVQLMPLEGNTISRDLDRAGFGGDQKLHVGSHVKISFSVEAVGSGTLGTAPGWGKLIKACGCSETIVAVTSVAYGPDRATTTSLTIEFYLDGQRHRMTGARGKFTLSMNSQNIPLLNFEFTGLWVDPATAAPPASLTGWADFQVPDPVTFTDTPTVTLHGVASVFTTFEFDAGQQVEFFDNPGEQYVGITDRDSTGRLTMLAPVLTTKNWFTTAKANTLGTALLSHGTVAARKVIFEAAAATVQVLQPKYGDDRGRATLECGLAFVPTSANDDDWRIRLAAA